MPIAFRLVKNEDHDGHCYRVYAPDSDTPWLSQLAKQYSELRSCCTVPLRQISLDGLEGFSLERLRARMQLAALPKRKSGALDIVRSDFGELLLYNLLEGEYGTQLGYKSVRDRELAQLPGRGIDAFGIELPTGSMPMTLVLGEAKVSEERQSPPQVVDYKPDGLKNQHLAHIREREHTVSKIFDQSRHVLDGELRDRLLAGALLLEEDRLDLLRIVACSALVRPVSLVKSSDYGSFRRDPSQYAPAEVRFLAVAVPEPLDKLLDEWRDLANSAGAADDSEDAA